MSSRRASHDLTRRTLLRAGLAVSATAAGLPAAALAQQEGPGARHMKRISKELLAAARSGSYKKFLRAVKRHADIREIAEYSLGEHRDKLKPSLSSRYRRGVTGFMARYFAIESKKYKVVGGEVLSETARKNGEVLVRSKINLQSGTSYTVNWLLIPHGKRFKVRDVQILGFWLTWFQKRMFVKFIDKNNGSLLALLSALRV